MFRFSLLYFFCLYVERSKESMNIIGYSVIINVQKKCQISKEKSKKKADKTNR